MKNTVIYTMEVTEITESDKINPPEAIKDALNADDVVVTKVQFFEGAEEGE